MKQYKILIAVLFFSAFAFSAEQIPVISFNQTPLNLVVESLSQKADIKAVLSTETGLMPITVYLENITALEALDSILQANGLYREKRSTDSNVYIITSLQPHSQTECIFLKHAKAQDLFQSLASLGIEKNVATDTRTNALIIRDTPQNIAYITTIIKQLDVQYQQTPLKTRIYRLQYAKASDLWAIILSVMKRSSADQKTNQSTATMEIGDTTQVTGKIQGSTSGGSGSSSASSSSGSSTDSSGSGQSSTGGGGQSALEGQSERKVSGKVQITTEIGNGFSIVPDERTNSLICVGTDNFLDEIAEIMASLDKPVPQISIEAVLVELSRDGQQDLGIKWGDAESGMGTFTDTITGSIIHTGGTVTKNIRQNLSFNTLSASLRFLENKGDANILANPRVTTMDASPATIRITSTIPIAPKVTTTSTGGTGTTTTEYEYRDIGIILVAVPHVNHEGNITLEVAPQVLTAKRSAFFKDAVETSERSTFTKVMVKNGETLVIGGLLSTETQESKNRIPGLGHIFPFLFSNKLKSNKKTDLVIFLTPRIVTEANARAMTEKEKERIEHEKKE